VERAGDLLVTGTSPTAAFAVPERRHAAIVTTTQILFRDAPFFNKRLFT
jgi:hypothetical protein